ncbi:MAG: hypothetical protein RLZZ423_1608 [Cyanobacteriota bacterium]
MGAVTTTTMTRPPRRSCRNRPGRRVRQRNRQVEAHRGLVAPIAAHYAAQSAESRDDLEQVGALGLIRAAELYDRRLAVPFDAYARRHVRGAILHYLRDTAPLVRQSRRLQERHQQQRQLALLLTRQLGRIPTAEDLRRALGLSSDQWQRQQPVPWEERWWREQQERCAGDGGGICGSAAQAEGVRRALQTLPIQQRLVLETVVLEGLSLRDAARRLHSSAATVHRLLHRGLAELRTRLTGPSDAPAC